MWEALYLLHQHFNESKGQRIMFTLADIAAGTAKHAAGRFNTSKFHGRARTLDQNGFIVAADRESDHPKAAKLYDREQACLAAILIYVTEVWGIDSQTQALFVDAIRKAAKRSSPSLMPRSGAGPAFDLARAIEGVGRGEKWVLRIDSHSVDAKRDFTAHFLPYSEVKPSDGALQLLRASGLGIDEALVTGLNGLFAPFAGA